MLGGASAAGVGRQCGPPASRIVIILILIWSRRLSVPPKRARSWIVGLFLLCGLVS